MWASSEGSPAREYSCWGLRAVIPGSTTAGRPALRPFAAATALVRAGTVQPRKCVPSWSWIRPSQWSKIRLTYSLRPGRHRRGPFGAGAFLWNFGLLPGSVHNMAVLARCELHRGPHTSNGFAVPKPVETHFKVPGFPMVSLKDERKLRFP